MSMRSYTVLLRQPSTIASLISKLFGWAQTVHFWGIWAHPLLGLGGGGPSLGRGPNRGFPPPCAPGATPDRAGLVRQVTSMAPSWGLALMMSFKDRGVPVFRGLRLPLLGLPTVEPARRLPMVARPLVEVAHQDAPDRARPVTMGRRLAILSSTSRGVGRAWCSAALPGLASSS